VFDRADELGVWRELVQRAQLVDAVLELGERQRVGCRRGDGAGDAGRTDGWIGQGAGGGVNASRKLDLALIL